MNLNARHGAYDNQPDPFNAPDPIMPGGEPDLSFEADAEPDLNPSPASDTASDAGRDADGIERMARRNEQREPGHHRHRPQRPAQPKRRAAQSGGTARTHRAGRPSHNAGTSGAARTQDTPRPRKRSHAGCIVLVIILLIVSGGISAAFSACSAAIDTAVTGIEQLFSGESDRTAERDDDRPAYSTPDHSAVDLDAAERAEDRAEERAAELVSSELDDARNGSEAAVTLVAARFEDTFTSYCNITPAQAGIDAAAVARWALAGMDATVESSYASSDPVPGGGYALDCSVYYDVTAPDVTDLILDLYDFITDSYGYRFADGGSSDTALAPEMQQAIAAELARLQQAPETHDLYLYVDLTGAASAAGDVTDLSIDNAQLDDNLGATFSLY